jgi:uncharacterized membrane protein
VRILAFVALVWVSVLPVAAAGAASSQRWLLSTVVYGIGQFICHQRPERSFRWASTPWPVCARCTGIYAGAAFSALLVLLVVRPSALPPARARLWTAAGCAPAFASLLYEWTSGVTPANLVRAATGFLLGGVMLWIVLAFMSEPTRSTAVASRPLR